MRSAWLIAAVSSVGRMRAVQRESVRVIGSAAATAHRLATSVGNGAITAWATPWIAKPAMANDASAIMIRTSSGTPPLLSHDIHASSGPWSR